MSQGRIAARLKPLERSDTKAVICRPKTVTGSLGGVGTGACSHPSCLPGSVGEAPGKRRSLRTICSYQRCWRLSARGCGVSWDAPWAVPRADRLVATLRPCRQSREMRSARSPESCSGGFIRLSPPHGHVTLPRPLPATPEKGRPGPPCNGWCASRPGSPGANAKSRPGGTPLQAFHPVGLLFSRPPPDGDCRSFSLPTCLAKPR
jgi:hypothetical protein